MYSSTLPSTSALDGEWVVSTTSQPLYPWERPGTQCIAGWVGPRAGLDGWGKSRQPPGFNPRTAQPVASRYTDWAIPAPYIVGKNTHTKIKILSLGSFNFRKVNWRRDDGIWRCWNIRYIAYCVSKKHRIFKPFNADHAALYIPLIAVSVHATKFALDINSLRLRNLNPGVIERLITCGKARRLTCLRLLTAQTYQRDKDSRTH